MTLVLEIEYLSGVSFAAVGRDSSAPDWPPQPDRVFSALVAAWAARGRGDAEADALRWLEKLPPPQLLASGAAARTRAIVFVPPNDPRSDRQKNARGVLPALRSRQPRQFPAVRPDDPVMRLYWTDARPDHLTLAALQRLARDTAYVGHSASLTRCRFSSQEDAVVPGSARVSERRVYAGRFEELRHGYATLLASGGKRGRPGPGAYVRSTQSAERRRTNVFGQRWLVLEHVGGEMPDVRASAIVAKSIRDTLLSGYHRIGFGDRIPEVVSGHAPDGRPSRVPHLAVVALAFVGFPYADGHVIGFALVPPGESAILDDQDFRKAVRTVAPLDEERGRRILMVKTKEGMPPNRAFALALSPTYEPARRSLDASLFAGPARVFSTVAPILLDRHLKGNGSRREQIAAQIASACRNIGLPEPEAIVADKHSALEGVPSAYPSGTSPSWMRWRVPESLASRQLTHATLRFAAPIDGPVILGAGRFVGLGLCRPLDEA